MREAHDKLDEINSLNADWDGEGAEKPSAVAIRNAKLFLFGLPKGPPSMSPCADGSIDAYWRTTDGPILVNFNPRGGMAFYAEIAGFKFKGDSSPAETTADEKEPPPPPSPPPKRVIGEYAPGFKPRAADETNGDQS